jgi:hypothetical protein
MFEALRRNFEEISDEIRKRHKDISCAAYYKWLAAGCPDGESVEFWLAAEKDWKEAHPPYSGPPGLYKYKSEDIPPMSFGDAPVIGETCKNDFKENTPPVMPGDFEVEKWHDNPLIFESPEVFVSDLKEQLQKKGKGDNRPQNPLPSKPETTQGWFSRVWKRIRGIR